jgi:Zn finger protein HypA/HybF involved in hydrogenase expression
MIIEQQAVKIDENNTDCATKVEILCPSCNRDVDQAELTAKKCNDCGADLSDPKQNITIAATSVPVFAITF